VKRPGQTGQGRTEKKKNQGVERGEKTQNETLDEGKVERPVPGSPGGKGQEAEEGSKQESQKLTKSVVRSNKKLNDQEEVKG